MSEPLDTRAPDSPTASLHSGPRSLLRTLRIIETIAGQPDVMTLARLSLELQTPKSSLLGLLRALTRYGYLTHEGNRYALGPAAHRLAIAIVPSFPLSQIAKPVMRDLVETTGETALLAVLDPELRRAVYFDKVESSSAIRYTVPVGTSRPLHSSAAGRVLLAHQPGDWITSYLEANPFDPLTAQADEAAFKRQLQEIKQQGSCGTLGELSPDVAGFSAPVFDLEGKITAALTLAAPIERGRRNFKSYLEATRLAAVRMSTDLGFVSPSSEAPPAKRVKRRTTSR